MSQAAEEPGGRGRPPGRLGLYSSRGAAAHAVELAPRRQGMLCALLLLPGVLCAALAGSISGPKECAKGPAVWCRDLQAATRCGAVGHCRVAVWSQPTTRSLPCDLCLDMAATASNGLNPKAAETDVLAAVMKTCEWLPSQESLVKCKGMVDAHGSAILSMLGGDLGSAPG